MKDNLQSKSEINPVLEGAIGKSLMKFAIPIILSMFAAQVYTVADNVIIGQFLDEKALAAVSNAASIIMVFLFVSGGLELGCSLLVSSKLPFLSKEKIPGLIYSLIFITSFLGIILSLLGFFVFPFLLKLIQTPPEIMNQAVLYGRIYMIGLMFQMVYDVSRELMIAVGNPKMPMYLMLVTCIFNIIFDIIWIPLFGIKGAAIATVLAQIIGAICMYVSFVRRFNGVLFKITDMKFSYVKELCRLAPPNMIQQAAGTISTIVKQGILGTIGTAAIAGVSCSAKFSTLLLMPVYGIAQAMVIFFAQNIAAKNMDRVTKIQKVGTKIMLCYTLFVIAVCMIFHKYIPVIFTDHKDAIYFGSMILLFEPISYLFTNYRIALETKLRGEQRLGLYLISNIGTIAMNILMLFIFTHYFGFIGLLIAPYVSSILGVILCKWLNR